MKSIKSTVLSAVVAAAALAATLGTAQAQNPNYAPGDLVLFFQNPSGTTGSTQQLFASLGNTATVFRQAYVDQVNLYDIVNIGSQLTSTFGSGWASATTLYGGVGGVFSASTGTGLSNGDPGRTLYTSMPRSVVGTVGVADSATPAPPGTTAMTTTANAIIAQNHIFETGGSGSILSIANGVGTTIQSINPTDSFGGGNSWNNQIPAPGVQQRGSASSFGTFDTINNVQFLWDIYRIQARNDVSGQFGNGDPTRTGLYLGTMVLTSSGDVSFVTAPIPEPGTWAAIAIAAVALGAGTYRRSRRRSEAVTA